MDTIEVLKRIEKICLRDAVGIEPMQKHFRDIYELCVETITKHNTQPLPAHLVDQLRAKNPYRLISDTITNTVKNTGYLTACDTLQSLLSPSQPGSQEGEDQETLWDEFFDQIVWDERESNHDVTQIMETLQRKYHITRK